MRDVWMKWAVFVLVVVSIIFGVDGCARRQDPQAGGAGIAVADKKLQEGKFDFVYPEVTGMADGQKQFRINKLLRESAFRQTNEIIEENKKVLTEEEQQKFSFQGRYEVKYNRNNILSVVFYNSSYMQGAAYPNNRQDSVTIDLGTGREYKLSDFFKAGTDYKKTVDDEVKSYIKRNDIQLSGDFNGINDNQAFYLKGKGVVVYFNDLTPHAVGVLEVPIDKKHTILK